MTGLSLVPLSCGVFTEGLVTVYVCLEGFELGL